MLTASRECTGDISCLGALPHGVWNEQLQISHCAVALHWRVSVSKGLPNAGEAGLCRILASLSPS